jgi:hypothetical protein
LEQLAHFPRKKMTDFDDEEKKTQTSKNACSVWDITIYNKDWEDLTTIKTEFFRKYCTKWVYQLEKGEQNKLHLQCRVHLSTKKRLTTILGVWGKPTFMHDIKVDAWHWSPTSNAAKDGFSYVMKEDTRIKGPWSSADIDEIPRLKKIWDNPHPWQKYIMHRMKLHKGDSRFWILIDVWGQAGKSTFAQCMEMKKLALAGIIGGNAKEQIQDLTSELTQPRDWIPNVFFFDIPRTTTKCTKESMAQAIEQVKAGKIKDARYAHKSMIFKDIPMVIITTNTNACVKWWSHSRVEPLLITKELGLMKYTLEAYNEMLKDYETEQAKVKETNDEIALDIANFFK